MVHRPIKAPAARHRSFLCRAAFSWLPLLFVIAEARGGLNLSPAREEYVLDGVKMWRLTFETGSNQKATYQPPRDWLYFGSADQLTLQPPGKTQTQVAITKAPVKEPVSFDEKGRKKLSEKALKALPPGNEQARIEAEIMSPLEICGKATYLVQLNYLSYGEKYSRYCLFLHLKDAEMRFQLTCPERYYKDLAQAFQKSLYSWQNL